MWPYPTQPEPTSYPPVHRKTTMTRIFNLFVATTLVILPISAFAQQTPGKDTSPSSKSSAPFVTSPANKAATATMPTSTTATNTMPTSTTSTTGTSTAGAMIPATKSGAKAAVPGSKTDLHSMNTVNAHHAKTATPAKIAEPAKS
jgi:hypothetical protein